MEKTKSTNLFSNHHPWTKEHSHTHIFIKEHPPTHTPLTHMGYVDINEDNDGYDNESKSQLMRTSERTVQKKITYQCYSVLLFLKGFELFLFFKARLFFQKRHMPLFTLKQEMLMVTTWSISLYLVGFFLNALHQLLKSWDAYYFSHYSCVLSIV